MSETTLKDVQKSVDKWINQFEEGYWSPLSILARLMEEVGELSRELNDLYGEKPKKEEGSGNEIALEVGDILYTLICLANSLDIDLEEALKETMEKYDIRDKDRWERKNL